MKVDFVLQILNLSLLKSEIFDESVKNFKLPS